jgi:Tfp pilus assembly protein PilW
MRRVDVLRSEGGFTLAELLVACAVVALVMAGLLVMLQTGLESYLIGSNRVEATQSVRLAIERMSREIRVAGFCPCVGTPPFTAITAQTATGFTLQYDWDGDGAINTVGLVTDANGTSRGERIIYTFAGGTLTRQEIGFGSQPLAVGINSLTFTYQDSAGATTAIAADIRAIVVTLTTQPQNQPAATQQGRVFVTMTDSVRLRNR